LVDDCPPLPRPDVRRVPPEFGRVPPRLGLQPADARAAPRPLDLLRIGWGGGHAPIVAPGRLVIKLGGVGGSEAPFREPCRAGKLSL
jgi:hypothetical protein